MSAAAWTVTRGQDGNSVYGGAAEDEHGARFQMPTEQRGSISRSTSVVDAERQGTTQLRSSSAGAIPARTHLQHRCD